MTYSPSIGGTSMTRLAASESSSSALCTLVVTQPAATTLKERQLSEILNWSTPSSANSELTVTQAQVRSLDSVGRFDCEPL